jgi:hypothetical protein
MQAFGNEINWQQVAIFGGTGLVVGAAAMWVTNRWFFEGHLSKKAVKELKAAIANPQADFASIHADACKGVKGGRLRGAAEIKVLMLTGGLSSIAREKVVFLAKETGLKAQLAVVQEHEKGAINHELGQVSQILATLEAATNGTRHDLTRVLTLMEEGKEVA